MAEPSGEGVPRVKCPDCGGAGKVAGTVEGVPASVCTKLTPCERCWPRSPDGTTKFWDDGSAGTIPLTDARGRQNGLGHPLWADDTPILIGQEVTWHVDQDERWGPAAGAYRAVVHEVGCEEIRIGGMDSDDEEWEEQVHPTDLSWVATSGRSVQ